MNDQLIVKILSPELIAALGLTAGAAVVILGLMLQRNNTDLVLDRTDLIFIGCVLFFVGINYTFISHGQGLDRSVAVSRLAWFAIFSGSLCLCIKYARKIVREQSEERQLEFMDGHPKRIG